MEGNNAGMERESTKHGRRLDEQLEHETEALVRSAAVGGHTREEYQQEALPDDDPDLSAGTHRDELFNGVGVTGTEADVRADLARHLSSVTWPADRAALLDAARADHAADHLVEWMETVLTAGRTWPHFQAVWDEMGGTHEGRQAYGS